ncbi:MAG: N-acetylmuramoyl-L-alanine amidase [Bryobacteraceae bacterium]
MNVIRKPCAPSNFRAGRQGHQVEGIVIHIVVGSQTSCDATFADPNSKVSAHYSVGRDGEIHQYVDEQDAAFHAGKVDRPAASLVISRPGVNPNFYTIGIEHEGKPDDEWTDAMYAASSELIREVAMRRQVPIDREHIIPHREIRKSKTCPGFKVDLDKLIALAAGGPAPAPPTNGVGTPRATVKLVSNVNIRLGAPTTAASIVRTEPKGKTLVVAGFRAGQPVSGNSNWYQSEDGNFFWAGATDQPNPV